MLGDERDGVQRRDAGLLHAHGNLRAVRFERPVRRHDAGLQYRHAHLPRLRGRRRMRGRDAGLSGVGRVRAVLRDERDRVRGRNARLLHAVGHVCAVRVECPVRRRDARVQPEHAHLPRVRPLLRDQCEL
jgi:hypothetical protein